MTNTSSQKFVEEELLGKETFDKLKNLYQRKLPYQYFEFYLQIMGEYLRKIKNESLEEDYLKIMIAKSEELSAQTNFFRAGISSFNKVKELKIVNISEDLIPLLEDTKPSMKDFRLKFPVMFINHQFNVGDNIINGILVGDMKELSQMYPNDDFIFFNESNFFVGAICLNKKDNYEFFSFTPLDEKDESPIYSDTSKERKNMTQIGRLIKRIACNLSNLLLNDEDNIDIFDVPVLCGQNKKREKKGKQAFRNTTTIRIGGSLKKYASEYCAMRGRKNPRHFVGGFWREHTSDRYKAMRGKKIWVRPFWRGMKSLDEKTTKFVDVKK